MLLPVLLLIAAAPTSKVAGPADGGAPDAGPATWRLSQKLGKGSALREALIADLTKDAGSDPSVLGQSPLTRAEADALLDDPRAELIYGEKTVAIVAPSMVMKQRQDHLDLMKLFLKPERLNAGADFVKQNRALLEAAQAKHGVDYEVIIGILTWESKLGTITGDYRAFNAFTSQAFFIDEANAAALAAKDEKLLVKPEQQAKRVETIRERARRNLLALVRQCKTRGMDVLEVKGSWAGAIGFPQFMPASLRWADDGDGDGKIDLFSFPDAIYSVGRYLSENGFKKSPQKALWHYNHEDAYVQGVLAYAEALKARLKGDGGAR